MIKYQYEVLKAIETNGGEIDVKTLLGLFTNGLSNEQLVRARNNVAIAIMNMADKGTEYIITNFSPHSDLSKYFDTQLWRQEREDEFGMSDADMKITITEDGMMKLKTLKELYDPTPTQPTYSAIFNDKFEGNFNQGNSEGLTQSKNNESDESKELAKKQLEDIKPNKWYRKWQFILAVAVIAIMLLTWLLPTCNKS